MKKTIKKMLGITAAAALTLSMGSMALIGCGDKGKDYVFEAEDAVLVGEAQSWGQSSPMSVETGATARDENVEVTVVGNFNVVNEQSITWTVTSDKECDAKITLHAASASMWMGETGMGLCAIDLSGTQLALTNNGTKISLTGTLPASKEGWDMNAEFSEWRNMGSGTGTIHLVKGKNEIQLKIVGAATAPEGGFPMSAGVNVDKIVINSEANLTFTKTDNSDKIMSM